MGQSVVEYHSTWVGFRGSQKEAHHFWSTPIYTHTHSHVGGSRFQGSPNGELAIFGRAYSKKDPGSLSHVLRLLAAGSAKLGLRRQQLPRVERRLSSQTYLGSQDWWTRFGWL